MARRENELFVGKEYLNIEGRSIKHPALFKLYANTNINKIKDKPIDLIGLDLETNHLTAELKLLGFWNGETYEYYTKDFLKMFFLYIKWCSKNNKSIAYWNRLDPFVIYKQFLLELDDQEYIQKSLKRFGQVSGEYSKKESKWTVEPIVKVEIDGYEFGIKNVVRSSVQFYFIKPNDTFIHTVWAYDIAQLFESNLETESATRLDYYSKVDKSAHTVDWLKYESDPKYQELVLLSNKLDARAVYDLGKIIQDEFKTAFNYYPNTLVSTGSLARSAVVADIQKYHINDRFNGVYPTDENDIRELNNLVSADVNSIAFINYYDEWVETYDSDLLKDFYCLTCETYSGGYIETIRYGFTEQGYTADITSAYPATIKDLYDLRDSKITTGKGIPPKIKNSYCFIRGTVNIPNNVNFHPITVKHPHPHAKDTNIRAVGEYVASYTLEERDFLIKQGAKFKDEQWYNIETTGKLSPIAIACNNFYKLRMKLRAENNSAQYMAKTAMNSLYGILFEAVDIHQDLKDGDVERVGYRVGEFFNPIYATIITSRTRLKLAQAGTFIEKNGGKVILLMTDSILWKGKETDLPSHLWAENKTLGLFEKPEQVNNIVCLGSGRYEYYNSKGKQTAKKRGLNATSIIDPDIILDESIQDNKPFEWLDALKVMVKHNTTSIDINVRSLVSVGMIKNNHSFNYKDLGLVLTQTRTVDAIVGANKRIFDDSIKNAKMLSTTLVDTEPICLSYGMNGKPEIIDQTLPILRELMADKIAVTSYSKRYQQQLQANKKYHDKNKEKISDSRKNNYKQLRTYGYTVADARKYAKWSIEKIQQQLEKDGKI